MDVERRDDEEICPSIARITDMRSVNNRSLIQSSTEIHNSKTQVGKLKKGHFEFRSIGESASARLGVTGHCRPKPGITGADRVPRK